MKMGEKIKAGECEREKKRKPTLENWIQSRTFQKEVHKLLHKHSANKIQK